MNKPGLNSLLAPTTEADFLPLLRAGKPLWVEAVSRVGELSDLPFLQSLEALLQSWPFLVQAHLPKVADEASHIEVAVGDAAKVFENGMGLLFDHAERLSPDLGVWLEAIRHDLGFSKLTQSRCLIYATPHGKGTAPHFDQNVNFVLQLHGTKTWWLAPNAHVQNPLSRHTMSQPPDAELASYARLPLPTEMPPGAQTVILKPGSLLFVPSGMWHSTRAEGDALSLNFTYHAPAWLDLLGAALRHRLAQSPIWRQTAFGVADRLTRELATAELDLLLSGLNDDLASWRAADILGATEDSSGH